MVSPCQVSQMLCCCHLCSGGYFLCSSGHHTQGVKGEHAQFPGAHSRLHKHKENIKLLSFECIPHTVPIQKQVNPPTHAGTRTLDNKILLLRD